MSVATLLTPREELDVRLRLRQRQAAARAVAPPRWTPRDSQKPPDGDWTVWLLLAGRGFGKTRTGAEWVHEQIRQGNAQRVALIGRTSADVRDVMVDGESGLLSCSAPGERPQYEPSRRRLTWPNGAIATTYTADEPDVLRGPQHDLFWGDEPATWKHVATWDNLLMGLRLGQNPRGILTTTPRPTKFIRDLIAQPTTRTVRGSTYENLENLAPTFRNAIIARYEGTRLARQELEGELLDDVVGALWKLTMFDERKPSPDLARCVVAIDPSGGDDEGNDEQGIVVAGKGVDGRGYVLADRSCKLSPDGWGRRAVQAYVDFKADRLVYEKNFGGDMVESVIQSAARSMGVNVSTRPVTASRGKQIRAEPVAACYERAEVTHCDVFSELEDQLVTWTQDSGTSPDRLDALVWALTDLLLGPSKTVEFY